jgi:hypothetical protein
VRLGQTELLNVTEFKYPRLILDRKLTWRLHAKYIKRRCRTRVNFMNSIAGQSWGAHLACLLVLYKSTVWSVIEYGEMCFFGMSDCHMRRLERIHCGGFCGSPSDKTEDFGLRLWLSRTIRLMVKLKELPWIWNNSYCLPKWQIVRVSRKVGYYR